MPDGGDVRARDQWRICSGTEGSMRKSRAAPGLKPKCPLPSRGSASATRYHGNFAVRRLILSSIPWLWLAACSREQTVHTANPPAQPVVPVTVGKVVQKTVPVEV